jgi:hypothetical protein
MGVEAHRRTAGHDDHGGLDAPSPHFAERLDAFLLRHEHIRDDQVDRAGLQLPEALIAVAGKDDLVAHGLQHGLDRAADEIVIIDNKNARHDPTHSYNTSRDGPKSYRPEPSRPGRDRDTARATLGKGLAVSAFPRSVPV